MKFNYPYLNDDKFLKVMDLLPQKEIFIKITSLDFFTENPIAEIQGRTTGGSINLDGKSAVRRTASINMVADENNYNIVDVKNIISINKKIAIEIGVTNTTAEYIDYPIIWYPQGVYVVNNATISRNNQGITMNIQAKDKMCLLNGDCGGTLENSTEFDGYDEVSAMGEETTRIKYPIYQMIARIVHELGGEAWERIIIDDVPLRIKRVVKWTGANVPLYVYKNGNTNFSYKLDEPQDGEQADSYQYGEDCGYVFSDFFYPSALEEQAGATLTSVLDKIKNTLGNYEYFYDIQGNFIFREIKNYLNTTIDLTSLDYRFINTDKAAYDLSDGQLVTSYQNNPQFNLIKNNFIIWGTRTSATGQKLPIRYHLALDAKPGLRQHKTYQFYIDREQSVPAGLPYLNIINEVNSLPDLPIVGKIYHYNGSYYRYDRPFEDSEYPEWILLNSNEVSNNIITDITSNDFRTELYLSGLEEEHLGLDTNPYFAELKVEWPKLYEVTVDNGNGVAELKVDKYDELDYFLDFIDSGDAYQDFGVPIVGRRTKVLNEKEVDCIFRKDPVDCVVIEAGQSDVAERREEAAANGSPWAQVTSNIFNACSFSESRYSAYEAIRLSLHEYIGYNRNVTAVVLPVYHLEPNTRIKIEDPDSGIAGDFMVKSFSIPLDINGTSSLSCVQAMDRL